MALASCAGNENRGVMEPSPNVKNVLQPIGNVSMKMTLIEPELSSSEQDRIKELETQIAVAQATRDAMHSADSSSRGSSYGRNHSSSDGSTPAFSDPSHVSPPTTASSPKDSVFSDRPSPSPATTSYEPRVDPNLIQSGPSLDQTKRLLDIFSTHSSQCGFELHLGRVMRGLVPGAEEPVIPALLNAMLLMGCHFVDDPSLKFWESLLIPRIKHNLEDNIDNAHGMGVHPYNSLHHLQAMIMLGVYYYFKGRLLEGHVYITQAARFATVLGITRLNSRIFRQETTSNEPRRGFGVRLWHPRDPVELGEAINMWWTCSTWDLGGSTMNGLPVAVPFEDVTTVWPRPLSDFELGYTLPDDNYSAAALLDPELSYIVADTSGDCPQALLAKANILMQHASRIDTQRVTCPQELETWWTSFERCDYSLNRFMKTMPPVGLARNPGELAFYILIHNAIYCGQVQLHCVQAEYELALGAQGDPRCLRPDGTIGGISYTICTEACKAASLASTLSLDLDPAYMHMFSGIGWVCVSEVVVRDVPKLRRLGRIAEAEAKERQGEIMERCMEKLVGTYPVLALQAEQLRAKKKEHLLLFCGPV